MCLALGVASIFPNMTHVLAITQEDVDQAKKDLDELKAQQASLSSDLAELSTQLETAGQRINDLDNRISTKQSEINQLQDKINELSIQMDEQYASMKLRIKYMYEKDSAYTLDILLSSESLADMLVKTEYIQQISLYDRSMLDTMQETYVAQKEASELLASDMEELSSLRTQASAEQENLNNIYASTQATLDTTSSNVTEAEQLALQYEQDLEAQKIAEQAAEEERARQEAAAAGSTAAGITNEIKPPAVSGQPFTYTPTDLAMLAAIIECEAGNQPYIGQLAVGSVVMNRVTSTRFANSISAVLYASGQFSPVASGRFAIVLARGARETCVQAAQETLNGNIVIDALYFHVYRSGVDNYGTVIGDHIFY